MAQRLSPEELGTIHRAVERVSERGWGIALGLLGGLILFWATAILLIKGGPNPGPHLSLLSAYFPGYRMSWTGACLGGLYGFTVGFIAGYLVGVFYNWTVKRFV